MLRKILENIDILEVYGRCLLEKFPNIKRSIKKRKNGKINLISKLDVLEWEKYKNSIEKIVGENSIILIHSSMDGLNDMGVSVKELLQFLLSLCNKGNTIVLPVYPISNLKQQNKKILKYNVQKTPCWTGILPNLFLKVPGVVRSKFPYNTLAAYGPLAEEIIKNNHLAKYVYGENSAWKYCVDHHAKILFLGISSLKANTIAAHMVPDILGEQWPVNDWYIDSRYQVEDNDEIFEINIKIQDVDKWAKYSTQYALEKELRKNNFLHKFNDLRCVLEYIEDAGVMVDYLIKLSFKGDLMFRIPKKYLKRR